MKKAITLTSGTGIPENYLGYRGVPVKDWNHFLCSWRWHSTEGLVKWIYFSLDNKGDA